MGRTVGFTFLGALAALLVAVPAPASASDVEPMVVGGTTTEISDYPWQAAVVYTGTGNARQRQFCGGSVITSRIVITAAHCVYPNDPDCSNPVGCALSDPNGDGTEKIDPNDVDVVLGRTTLSDSSSGSEISVQAVSYRSTYDETTEENDVAYLVLSSPSTQTPIEIAGPDEGALWDVGSPVEITGWGSTSETGNTVDTLRMATVEVISDGTCGSSSVYGSEFHPASMVCAGYLSGGIDTCYGDSGGPLEAPLAEGGYRLVGITSWGYGCAEPNAPGVYTRIAGSTLRPLAELDVYALEVENGLAHEQITGSGGNPKSADLPSPSGGSATGSTAGSEPSVGESADPYRKCKRPRTKEKRKRCIRKVKARLAAQL